MATETIEKTLYDGDVKMAFYPNSHRYKELESKQWVPGATTITNMLDKSRPLITWAIGCFEKSLIKGIEEIREGVFSASEIKALIEVSRDAHNQEKDIACDIGSVFHDYADNVAKHEIENGNDRSYLKIKGGLIPDEYSELSPLDQQRAENSMNAFDTWIAEKKPEFLESEFFVYSKKKHHGGTCDALVRIDGKLYILDYKSGKGIYTSHLYQTASYFKAKEEELNYVYAKKMFEDEIQGENEKINGAMIINVIKDDVFNSKGELTKMAGEVFVHEMSRSDLLISYMGFKNLLGIYNVEKQTTAMLK